MPAKDGGLFHTTEATYMDEPDATSFSVTLPYGLPDLATGIVFFVFLLSTNYGLAINTP